MTESKVDYAIAEVLPSVVQQQLRDDYIYCSKCKGIIGEWQGETLKLKHGDDETIIIGASLVIRKCRHCRSLTNICLTKERVST